MSLPWVRGASRRASSTAGAEDPGQPDGLSPLGMVMFPASDGCSSLSK